MPYMKVVIDSLMEAGIRDKLVVLVGGAPLSDAFAEEIRADAYCRDAAVAVEMAKLSLWLITLDKGRPFTFLDHALKAGDSILGADEDMLLRWVQTMPGPSLALYLEEMKKAIARARSIIFRDDWRAIFQEDDVRRQIADITS
jgi:hypothetical protein